MTKLKYSLNQILKESDSSWKRKFITAVWHLLHADIYPSAGKINYILKRNRRDLNGRECQLRTNLFKLLGIKKQINQYR